MKKRLITFVLLLTMFLSVGCSGDKQTDTKQPPDTASTVTTEAPETEDLLNDELGEFDFNKYKFRVLSVTHNPANAFTQFDAETITGEIMNDALYKRNRELEKRFNFVFEPMDDSYANNFKRLKNAVGSQSDEFDMVQVINRNAFSAAVEGLLMPVDELTYLNPKKPYYMHEINNQMSIKGKNFFYYSEESVYTLERTNCLAFNYDIVEDNGLGDYYQLVRDKKWTLERLYSDAQKVTKDVDGNSIYDENDIYGLIGSSDWMFAGIYNGAGELTIRKNSDDIPYFASGSSERFANIIEELLNQLNSGPHIRVNGTSNRNETVKEFVADRALFAGLTIGYLQNCREMENDYGVLPYPLYDETQDQYYSRVLDGWLHVVPITNPDPVRTSVIMEALASASAKQIIPAYYDNVLSMRALRDEEGVEMLDLIRATRMLDMGECPWFSAVRSKYTTKLLYEQSVQLASLNASIEPAINALIESAVTAIDALP